MAQTQLAGGGEQKSGRAASPLPTSATTSVGEMTESMQRQVAAMHKEQSLLLAQVKNLLAQLPTPQPQQSMAAQDAIEQKRRQLLKLLAEIEKRINQDNARPRKHYVSPATKQVAYALYYDTLRRKIEDRGTRYFPATNSGQKLYGELTMIITVNTDGRVLATEVVQSSGLADLDRRAQAIATAAGPFGEFTEEMRKQADQLAVVSRFIFSRDNTLQTKGGEAAN
jgi:protein TonB